MRRVPIPRWALTLSVAGLSIFAAAPLAAQGATVTGRITETGSGQPIQEARVIILGTSLFTTSGQDGKYTVRNVSPGTAEVRVIRVGYEEQKKSVTVAGEIGDARLRAVAEHRAAPEVVTTATGEQRRVELGNSVAKLDAGKIAAETPILALTTCCREGGWRAGAATT